MISPSEVYFVTMLDGLGSWLKLLTVLSLIFLAVTLLMIGIAASEDKYELIPKVVKFCTLPCVIIFLILGTIVALLPNTKQMAAIIIIPRIANNEKVQDVGKGLYDLAVQWMEELKPRKEVKEVAK